MEEADKGWLMIRIGEWVNVSSGTSSVPVDIKLIQLLKILIVTFSVM